MMQKFFFENGILYSESELSEYEYDYEYIILIIFLHFYSNLGIKSQG